MKDNSVLGIILILSFLGQDVCSLQRHRPGRTANCPKISVHKNTIIKTKESIRNGAKLLRKIHEIKSARECYSECCLRDNCDIGVMHYRKELDEDSGDEIVTKICFLFQCGYPNKCTFLNHTNYAVIQLHREEEKINKKKNEITTEKPAVTTNLIPFEESK